MEVALWACSAREEEPAGSVVATNSISANADCDNG
jgi:hypothetical protein